MKKPLYLDTSEHEKGHLLIGPNGGQARVSEAVYELLRSVEAGIGFDSLAEILSRQRKQEVTAEEVRSAYERIMTRLGEIDAEDRPSRLPATFWLRVPLLSQEATARVASRLSRAFAPGWRVPLIALALLPIVAIFAIGVSFELTGADLLLGYGLFLLSLMAHELGHASACAWFGARPAEIGFTFYLIYPALYSDVSAAWRLPRKQRVVVDLAGAFFQLVVCSLYWIGHASTGWDPLQAAILMIWYSLLFSLNPVFRFDGYWVVSDALGVTNLARQPKRIAAHAWARLLGRPTRPLPWPKSVLIFLVLYVPLTIGVWTVFLLYLVPTAWDATLLYPDHLYALAEALARPAAGSLSAALTNLLATTLFLFIIWFLLARMAYRFLIAPAAAAIRRRRTAGQPSDTFMPPRPIHPGTGRTP